MVNEDKISNLIAVLRHLFQLRIAENNFGVYRILNIKKEEITNFIETDIFHLIQKGLEDIKIIPELRKELEDKISVDIINFFSRYCDRGGFFSKGRYSKARSTLISFDNKQIHFNWATNNMLYVKSFTNLKEESKSSIGDPYIKTKKEKLLDKNSIKNTTDYFFYKDLELFLTQELDFYIKNELYSPNHIETNVLSIKIFKQICNRIIDFLVQIEEFNKKLWLKKKLVINTDFIITLDRISHQFYDEILDNDLQLNEWKELFNCSLQKDEKLLVNQKELKNEYKTLPVDTKYFSNTFKAQLLNNISDNHIIDDFFDGILIKSDNFHALQLLKEKYSQKIKCIYIDPPYNTGENSFEYKDRVDHSSWLSMMYDRLLLAKEFLTPNGTICISIDDNELHNLLQLLYSEFEQNCCKLITIKVAEPTGVKMAHVKHSGGIAKLKEHLVFIKLDGISNLNLEPVPKEVWDNAYNLVLTGISANEIETIKAIIENEARTDEDIELTDNLLKKSQIIPLNQVLKDYGIAKKDEFYWKMENAWRIIRTVSTTDTARELADQKRQHNTAPFFSIITRKKRMYIIKNGYNQTKAEPRIKILFADKYLKVHPGDFWADIKTTGLDKEGNIEFKHGKKPEKLLQRIITMVSNEKDIIMDFFIGSGTSAAVAHKLGRKYIGVEFGDFFEEKTLIRMKNVFFGEKFGISNSVNWKGGGALKYHVLEQFEDILSNFAFKSPIKADIEIQNNEGACMFYFNVLKNEFRFNFDILDIPFNFKQKIWVNHQIQEKLIDLVETFNYLLGLFVESIYRKDLDGVKYIFVRGKRNNKKILIIWRDKNKFFDLVKDKDIIDLEMQTDTFFEVLVNNETLTKGLISIGEIFKRELFI